MFHFKQFSDDQTGCAMKINTDGVLLGALVKADKPQNILDIGTGTGVIALMLAQRFDNAIIDAVEIDEAAAQTANNNFINSPFANRLNICPVGFEQFFDEHPAKKYDLIVANPPFYINSLKSKEADKSLAKHAGKRFFEELTKTVTEHLAIQGLCYFILPINTAVLVKKIAIEHGLHLHKVIKLYSFNTGESHREILTFGLKEKKLIEEKFVIYDQPNIYSKEYQLILKDFLTIF